MSPVVVNILDLIDMGGSEVIEHKLATFSSPKNPDHGARLSCIPETPKKNWNIWRKLCILAHGILCLTKYPSVAMMIVHFGIIS